MIDRERILAKLDELDGYLRELRSIAPAEFSEYQIIEKKHNAFVDRSFAP